MTARAGADQGRPSLMAVVAHPDDESLACGGLLARCAAAGVRTSILCLTRGEHGPVAGGVEAAAGLADVRSGELREAARALGVRDVHVLEHEDGMLPWLDAGLLVTDVLDAIRRFEPDVVVTFDEDGLYWHPDHIAVHERVTEAVAALGSSGPALYYASLPAGAMRSVVEASPGAGPSLLGVDDPDAFGAHAPEPTLVVEAGDVAGLKLAALRCHRSQVGGSALAVADDTVAARLLGREHYRRAPIGRAGGTFIDRFGEPAGEGRRPAEAPAARAHGG